jgi:hypothetical protein
MQSEQTCSNKEEYLKIIEIHKKTIQKSREIISDLLDKLNDEIKNLSQNNNVNIEPQNTQKFLWGDKESITATIIKLSTILHKILPLEQKLYQLNLEDLNAEDVENTLDDLKIETEDLEILQRYTDKILSEKTV